MNSIPYFILEAFKGLKRNFSVTIASIFTVIATLFIFGVFMMTAKTTSTIVKSVEEKIEVKVFMNKNFTSEEKDNVEKKIKEQPGVADIQYESREDAFNKAKEMMGNYLNDKDPINNNPFPASFVVKMEKPEYIEPFIKNLTGTQGIEEIGNEGEVVDKVIAIGKTIKIVGIGITVLFIVVSIFLIGNTIKLGVFARRREIEIMKFVGATNWFIRWPFILEGIIIGLVGSAIATLLLYFGYQYAFTQLHIRIPFIILPSPEIIKNDLSWKFILSGVLIGAIGSFTSIRKHLKV